ARGGVADAPPDVRSFSGVAFRHTHMPEYVRPEDLGARLLSTRPAADEVALALIRRWCVMTEDASPLYYDEDFARTTRFGGIVARPTMLMAWMQAPTWDPRNPVSPTWDPVGTGGGAAASARSYNIGLRHTHTIHRLLRVGERPIVETWATEPSDEVVTER